MLHLLSFFRIKSVEVLSLFHKLQTRIRTWFGKFLVFSQLFEFSLVFLHWVSPLLCIGKFSATQGVRLALSPLRHPTPGMGPFVGPFFRSEWAPLGGLGDRNFDAGAECRDLFLVWPPILGGKKTSKCECSKCQRSHPVDRPKCMSFDTSSLKNVLLTHGNVHIAKMRIFRNFEHPHFCTVFSTICCTVVKKNSEPRARFQGFWKPLDPF